MAKTKVLTIAEKRIDLKVRKDLQRSMERVMKRRGMSQSDLAREMRTGRAVVHRLLHPRDGSMILSTVVKFAVATNARIRISLVASRA